MEFCETFNGVQTGGQCCKGESCSTTATVTKETEPMGGMFTTRKEVGKGEEDGEKPAASTSVPGKGLTGHAAKTLPPSSSSSSSSSAGRAKMSVSGPGSKPFPPPSSSSSSSSPPLSSAPPPKIHRARKTMNRPPPTQVRCLESPIVPVQPTEPLTCSLSDSNTAAAKRRKLASDAAPTAPPAEKAENSAVVEREPVQVSPKMEGVGPGSGPGVRPVAEQRSDWTEDWEAEPEDEEFRLFYNSYGTEDRGDSDSKSGDGGEGRRSEGEGESGNSSGGEQLGRGQKKKGGRSESPWTRPGRRRRRGLRGQEAGPEAESGAGPETGVEAGTGEEAEMEGEKEGAVTETAPAEGGSSEYTEVPLGSLDIAAADSLTLSPHQGDSEGGETERLEECSVLTLSSPQGTARGRRSGWRSCRSAAAGWRRRASTG
ncbi:hypothetical protein MATL_G00228500 [Megalops atlanticus]|uniref:Uncharacterized protein n=1 Tax=Megalops atlanticus TaxID=7932 RepID=A0A9D3T1S9_MEGAT|nr:hypothetical protein MATL_G00228500 [Megalops atlanticus]